MEQTKKKKKISKIYMHIFNNYLNINCEYFLILN